MLIDNFQSLSRGLSASWADVYAKSIIQFKYAYTILHSLKLKIYALAEALVDNTDSITCRYFLLYMSFPNVCSVINDDTEIQIYDIFIFIKGDNIKIWCEHFGCSLLSKIFSNVDQSVNILSILDTISVQNTL